MRENISRLSNVAKNKNFADLQTLPKCVRLYLGLYGGVNISRLKFSLIDITPKTTKSAKISPLQYLGYIVVLKDKTIIILEALIAYEVKDSCFIICGKQKEYNIAS